MADVKIETISDSVEAKVLGQRVTASETYDPSILVAVPRETNRIPYNITDDDFYGYDVWNAYECTFLTKSGRPFYFALRIKYDSYSKFIVESKSLKLYFNSFNNYVMGEDPTDALNKFLILVRFDLVHLLDAPVELEVINSNSQSSFETEFFNIANLINLDKISITKYNEDCKILRTGDHFKFKVYMEGLMSHCQVTGQPDHSTILIDYSGETGVDLESLYQYIVSHRKENRFHEATLETIFKHVKDAFNPEVLTMQALYTRRGGIDINPLRTLDPNLDWPHYRSFYQ